MSATGKAAALGTEHGTRAAEEWLAVVAFVGSDRSQWLQPDLSGNTFDEWDEWDTYSAAFTAAVEATIRQACQTTELATD